jgi:hypothetical protein
MAFIDQIGEGVVNPLVVIWNSFVSVTPGIIAALIILIIGYLIALIIGSLTKQLVRVSQVDDWMAKHKKQEAIGGLVLSDVAGKLMKWLVFILFIIPAANVINLDGLSSVLVNFALWFPNLIIAVIILLVGLVLAQTFAESIGRANKLKGIKGIKSVVKIATILIFLDIALRQIGVNVIFVESVVLVILAGLMIAIAIGFGLGLKPHADDIIKNWRRKFR